MLKTFLANLISNTTKVSSKRFSAIILVVTLISLIYVGTFTIYKAPQEMFDTLAILCGTLFGSTVFEGLINKRTNGTTKDTSEANSRRSSETISTNANANSGEEIIG